MKKSFFFVLLTSIILVLLSGCFLPFNKEYTVAVRTTDRNGEAASFAKVQIDGKEFQTDENGEFSLELKRGAHTFFAREAGSQSSKQSLQVKGELRLELVMNQPNLQSGFIYRSQSGKVKATFVVPASQELLAAIVQLPASVDQAQITWCDEEAFGNSRIVEGRLQLEWSHLFKMHSHDGIFQLFSLESDGEISTLGLQMFHKGLQGRHVQGSIVSAPPFSRVARGPVFGLSDLAKVGDIATGPGPVAGSDGVVDVWDLILMLDHYGMSGGPADGDLTTTQGSFPRPNHPSNPQPFDPSSLVPNGNVDVFDLIVLLNAYTLDLDMINTPFAPQTFTYTGSTRTCSWTNSYDGSDVLDGYKIYQASGGVVPPDTAVPVATIPRGTFSHTFAEGELNQTQLYLEAYNSSYRSLGLFVSRLTQGFYTEILGGGTFVQGSAAADCEIEVIEVDAAGDQVPDPDLSGVVIKRGSNTLVKNTHYTVNDTTNRIYIKTPYLNSLLSVNSPVVLTIEKTAGGVSDTVSLTVQPLSGQAAITVVVLSGGSFQQNQAAQNSVLKVTEVDSAGNVVNDPDLSQVVVMNGSTTLTKNTHYTVNDSQNTISLLPVFLNSLSAQDSPVGITVYKSPGGLNDSVALVVMTVVAKPTASNLDLQGTLRVGEIVTALYDYFNPGGYDERVSQIRWFRADDANGTAAAQFFPAANPNPNNALTIPYLDQTKSYRLQKADENKFIQFRITPFSKEGIPQGDEVASGWFGPVLPLSSPPSASAPIAYNVFVDSWDGSQFVKEVGQNVYGQYRFFDINGDAEAVSTYQWYRGSASDGSDKSPITGAVGQAYTLANEDRGKYIFFEVTPRAGVSPMVGAKVLSQGYGPILGAVPPVATNPSISGSLFAGSELTAVYTYFDANGDPESGTLFQWKSAANVSGTGAANIPGATTKALRLPNTLIGKYISVEVTPKNEKEMGTKVVTSWYGPIQDPTYSEAQKPVAYNVLVSGGTIEGQWVSGAYTYFDYEGNVESGTTVKWYRSTTGSMADRVLVSSHVRSTQEITGQQNNRYFLQEDDVDHWLQFEVIPGTNVAPLTGDPARSPFFGPISANAQPPEARNVVISGSQTVESILTGNYTFYDPNGDPENHDIAMGPATNYQWQRANSGAGLGAANIAGAVFENYRTVNADIGKYIRFGVKPCSQVPPTDGQWYYSPWIGPITGNSQPPARPVAFNVSIQGIQTVGQNLTGVYQYSDVNGEVELGSTLKWYLADDSSGAGMRDTGVAAGVLPLLVGYSGKYVAFEVTPRNAAAIYPDGLPAMSSWVGPISGPCAPEVDTVAVQGTPRVNEILSVTYNYTNANSNPEGNTEFAWSNANDAGGNGAAPIPGATSRSYQVQPGDLGKYIQIEVTPHDYLGTLGLPVSSIWVGPVQAASAPTPGALPMAFNVTLTPPTLLNDEKPTVGNNANVTWDYFDANGDLEQGNGAVGSSEVYWYRLDSPEFPVSSQRAVISVEVQKDFVNFPGQPPVPYLITPDDLGKYLVCKVIPKNVAAEIGAPVFSNIIGPVVNVSPPTAFDVDVLVGLDGVPRVGTLLDGQYTYFDENGDPEAVSTFQWYRADYNYAGDSRAVDTAIVGAVFQAYTPVAADKGKYLRFEVTPVNGVPETGNPVKSGYIGPILGKTPPTLKADEINIWRGNDTTLSVDNPADPGVAAWLAAITDLVVGGTNIGASGGGNWNLSVGNLTILAAWSAGEPAGLKKVVVKATGYADASVHQLFTDGASVIAKINASGTGEDVRKILDDPVNANALGLDPTNFATFQGFEVDYRNLVGEGVLNNKPYTTAAGVQAAFDSMFLAPGGLAAALSDVTLPILYLTPGAYQGNFVVNRTVTILGPNYGRCYASARVPGAQIIPEDPSTGGPPLSGSIHGMRLGVVAGTLTGVVLDGLDFVLTGLTLAAGENVYQLHTFLATGESVENTTVKNCLFDSSAAYGQPNPPTSPVSMVFTDQAMPGGGSVENLLVECNYFKLESAPTSGFGFMGLLAQLPGQPGIPNRIVNNKFERVNGTIHSADLGRPYGIDLQNSTAHQTPDYWSVEQNWFAGNFAFGFAADEDGTTPTDDVDGLFLNDNRFEGDTLGRGVYLQNDNFEIVFLDSGQNTFTALDQDLLITSDANDVTIGTTVYQDPQTETADILVDLKD